MLLSVLSWLKGIESLPQTLINSARAYSLSLKYLRFTPLGSIDIGIGNLSLLQRLNFFIRKFIHIKFWKSETMSRDQNSHLWQWSFNVVFLFYSFLLVSVLFLIIKCALQQWKGRGGGLCPMCRNSIQDVIKIYRSWDGSWAPYSSMYLEC